MQTPKIQIRPAFQRTNINQKIIEIINYKNNNNSHKNFLNKKLLGLYKLIQKYKVIE